MPNRNMNFNARPIHVRNLLWLRLHLEFEDDYAM